MIRPLAIRDNYYWRAHYGPDAYLDEYAPDAPDGRGFAEVDLDRLTHLSFLPVVEGRSTITLAVGEGMTPRLFRRRTLTLAPGPTGDYDGEPFDQTVVHCLSFSDSLGRNATDTYLWLFEDGSILLSNTPDAV